MGEAEKSKYVQDGFIDKWMNNFGKVTSSGSYGYGMHRNVVVRSEDASYVADIDKDKIDTVNNVYNSIFTKMGDSLVCLGEEKEKDGKKEYELLGVWDATSQSNYEPRGYLPLEQGTVVTPIYDVYDSEFDKYESEYGEEYTISSDFDFLFGKLNDSEYSYAFAIEEINGATSYTNLVEYEKN